MTTCACGKRMHPWSARCATCYDAAKRAKWKITERICVICGTSFLPKAERSMCCSRLCGQERSRATWKARRLPDTPVRQARRRHTMAAKNARRRLQGRRLEVGRWRRICERDGWDCWLCHGPIDRTLRAPHLLSGTCDHVVPLTKGGSDEDTNLKAAHFGCNSRRGAGLASKGVLRRATVIWRLLQACRAELRRRRRVATPVVSPAWKDPKPCVVCRAMFQPSGPSALYCSRSCSVRAGVERRTPRQTPAAFTCKECGAEVVCGYGDKRRGYCSTACSKRASSRVLRQRYRRERPAWWVASRRRQRQRYKSRKLLLTRKRPGYPRKMGEACPLTSGPVSCA